MNLPMSYEDFEAEQDERLGAGQIEAVTRLIAAKP